MNRIRRLLPMPSLYRLMIQVSFLTLICSGCSGSRQVAFDPFSYNPNSYEKVKLHYTIEGKGDTTLLFIHGWNLDHTIWQNQVAEFSPSYNLVLPDLAGHGQSGTNRKNWTIESFARDITGIIRKERLRNVILVAHSMGGEIALDVATAVPKKVIGIIGVDNLKNVGMTISEEQRRGAQPYIKTFLAGYARMAEAMARAFLVSTDSTIVQRIVNQYRNADPGIAVPTLMNLFPKAADAKNKLLQIPFRMKFIMCTNTPYDEQALKMYCKQGYTIAAIDSSGHFPMIEQPAAFNKALRQLLQLK